MYIYAQAIGGIWEGGGSGGFCWIASLSFDMFDALAAVRRQASAKMPLFKATSMDAGLERPRSASAVHVDDEVDHGEVALTPAPRSNVPPWYRGLHQSIRTLSQSGLDLHQLEEDSDEDDDDEILGTYQTTSCNNSRRI